jgi:hypothetical protein
VVREEDWGGLDMAKLMLFLRKTHHAPRTTLESLDGFPVPEIE